MQAEDWKSEDGCSANGGWHANRERLQTLVDSLTSVLRDEPRLAFVADLSRIVQKLDENLSETQKKFENFLSSGRYYDAGCLLQSDTPAVLHVSFQCCMRFGEACSHLQELPEDVQHQRYNQRVIQAGLENGQSGLVFLPHLESPSSILPSMRSFAGGLARLLQQVGKDY